MPLKSNTKIEFKLHSCILYWITTGIVLLLSLAASVVSVCAAWRSIDTPPSYSDSLLDYYRWMETKNPLFLLSSLCTLQHSPRGMLLCERRKHLGMKVRSWLCEGQRCGAGTCGPSHFTQRRTDAAVMSWCYCTASGDRHTFLKHVCHQKLLQSKSNF